MTDITVDLFDIFDKHEYTMREDPRRILIEGSPGMGKTTLSLKIAYEWAMGRMPSKFPPVQLVLLIKCRGMKGDILNAINEQLLPKFKDSLKKKLPTFIEEQPEKILLVVDGLDEIPEAASEHVIEQFLTSQSLFRKCYIVVTSRQEKGMKVRKYFDTLLEIEGYSESDIKEYVTRYFQDNDPSLAKRLIENLRTDTNIRTLAINPLNTVLLCVVFEEYHGKLPSTVTELYDNIVFCITKRYRKKCDSEVEDSILETSKETLGRLAYKGLLEDALSFQESELNDDGTTNNHCTKMGFLYKEHSKQKIKPDHTYWFLHKTFQEYLAAFYLTEKVKRQELTVGDMINKLKDTEWYIHVLKFVSGILHKKDAVHHMEFVEKLGKWILEDGCGDKERTLDVLCEYILSESSVDKDIAGIIHQFLPQSLLFDVEFPQFEDNDAVLRIMPRLLNQICTKDGVNREVYINYFKFGEMVISALELTLICEALKEKLTVRKLSFYESTAVDDEIAKQSFRKAFHCNWRNSFTTKSTKILAETLCQNCNLEELYFFFISLPDVGAILAALTPDPLSTDMAAGGRGSVLHTLVLRNIKCDEHSAFAAAKMLRTNNTLKRLEMSWNSLGSEGVTYMAEALKLNRTLNYLCLTGTGGGDEGAAALADMLRCNETLTELFISNDVEEALLYNEIGEDGAVAFADALRVNNSLKELHLADNNITDEGLKCLTKALLENTVLEKLCVMYPGVGLAALDQDTSKRVKETITWDCYCTDIDILYLY